MDKKYVTFCYCIKVTLQTLHKNLTTQTTCAADGAAINYYTGNNS